MNRFQRLFCGLTFGALSIVAPTEAASFKVLYAFKGSDGNLPYAGLVKDKAGNFYGTTVGGGASERGTVFKLAPDGTETVLHSFAGQPKDGSGPRDNLVIDRNGNLFGTTVQGGGSRNCGRYGCGTVFQVASNGKEKVLYAFNPAQGDGSWPNGGVVLDKAGNLYGTTYFSGLSEECCGTVFKITSTGTETILHSFAGHPTDGSYPSGDLIVDSSGNLYGTTTEGGSCNAYSDVGCGTVFKVASDGTETVLYSFAGPPDGCGPYSGLLMDKSGNLYGSTSYGGNGACNNATNAGTIFKLSPDGTETVLHAFNGSDGQNPFSGLVADKSGNLYGTTSYGGARDFGTVFKHAVDGTETVVHSFSRKSEGIYPLGTLMFDGTGNLIGTTEEGGIECLRKGCGTVFEINP